MSTFSTNRNLDNVFFDEDDEFKRRLRFFIKRKDWYDEKGGVNPKGAYDAGGHFHLDRVR